MELVECSNLPGDHWYSILDIRNENCEGFGDSSIIPIATHHAYMFKNYSNYLVCIEETEESKRVNEEVVGFIGHVENDIRLATKKTHQNKGVGKFMVEAFIEKFPNSFAKVKINNEASRRLFESCGFRKKYYILEK
jgi:RimJ/RimL family protein N-acetyltransferase